MANSFARALIILIVLGALASTRAHAQIPRSLGLDVSAWQGNLSAATWASFNTTGDRDFAIIRSSRGGTTGYYNQSNADNDKPPGQNTLSQRYDDPYFIQNITLATKQGMFAGAYHFDRADIVASTLNSNGIANTGADEATHFYQMAGAWMRPGYMLPMLDLEAGASQHSVVSLSNWAMEFSNKIVELAGVRPLVYVNTSYATSEVNAAFATAHPGLVLARPAGGADPLTAQPPTPSGFANPYGVWQTAYGATPPPWKFWQYSTTGGIGSFGGNLDKDVANGGIEFVKDYLVPALWTSNSSGDWSEKTKWNSGVVSVQPTTGPGQVAPVGVNWNSGALPSRPKDRLPGEDDTVHNVDGQNDTVVIDRGAANPVITFSSGSTNIRKLYAKESLNITGGALTINYVPSADSTPIAAQFSAAVSLSGAGSVSVHTLQVDNTRTFTLGGGTLTLNRINLMPHATATSAAKLLVTGDVNFNPLSNAAAVIANGAGSGNSGRVDLGGGTRTFNVGNGTAPVDLTISTPIINGGLTKAGPGALALTGANAYVGDTTVQAGKLTLGTSFLANSADLYLTAGATLDLGFTGADLIDSLFIDGVQQFAGVWGAEGSGAQYTSPLITGTGKLQVTTYDLPPSPADFNGDGRVDAADTALWGIGFGLAENGQPFLGDTDGDQDVDGHDFLMLQRQLGYGVPESAPLSAAVPEPAAAALAAIAAVGALACRHRPRSWRRDAHMRVSMLN